MAKRGRPKKNVESPKETPQRSGIDMSADRQDTSHSFDSAEREALYDSFKEFEANKEVTLSDESESVAEETETETIPEEIETETVAEETVVEETEESTEGLSEKEEYASEEKPPEEQKEDEKVVPYGALKEEREKRKELSEEVKMLREDNRKFMEKLDSLQNPEDVSNEFVEPEIKHLQNENRQLKEEIEQIKGRFQQDDEKKAEADFEKTLNTVNDDLEKDGFFGFNAVGRGVVAQMLNDLGKEHGQEYRLDWDNPEGWKKLYKKKYPDIKKMFISKDKEEKYAGKRKAKATAGLTTSTGARQSTTTEKKEWTREDYIKERQKYLV